MYCWNFSKEETIDKLPVQDSRKTNTIKISTSKKTYKRSNLKAKKTFTVKVTKASGNSVYKGGTKALKIVVK